MKNAGKAAGKTGQAADAATKKTAQAGEKGARFIARHWKGALLVLAIGLLILVLAGGISSCTNMVIGGLGAVTATSYPSEEQDMKEVEAAYTAMEQDLQYELDNYESLNPGYDEYRFDLDGIHHDPHELAAYLSAYFGGAYTPASAQGRAIHSLSESRRSFDKRLSAVCRISGFGAYRLFMAISFRMAAWQVLSTW